MAIKNMILKYFRNNSFLQFKKLKYFRFYYSVVPRLHFEQFSKLVPKSVLSIYLFIIRNFLSKINIRLQLLIIPKRLKAFIGTTLVHLKMEEIARSYFDSALKDKFSNKFALSQIVSLEYNYEKDISQIIEKTGVYRKLHPTIYDSVFDGLAFWNLNHKHFYEYLNLRISKLQNKNSCTTRYLPEYGTNLGHLGALFLYVNHFRKTNFVNHIIIPEKGSHNDYYLNLIRRASPINISLGKPEASEDFIEDTLLLNQEGSLNTYRIAADAAFYGQQIYDEWEISNDFKLILSSSEVQNGFDQISGKIKSDRWIVLLHVRQPKNGSIELGQCRDSNINSYSEMCELIWDLGGQVVRMGDSRFPSFSHKDIVFDYANSEIRSNFLDCWLWNQCKFWVGNSHGASIPPLTFNKPRLMSNQWYWNLIGGRSDVVLPKLLTKNGDILNIENTITSSVSRTMDRRTLQAGRFALLENSSDDLMLGFMQLFEISLNSFRGQSSTSKTIGERIRVAQNLSEQNSLMIIPNQYSLKFT
jgi:putative glycosyltransferase (TIGR04372 family)